MLKGVLDIDETRDGVIIFEVFSGRRVGRLKKAKGSLRFLPDAADKYRLDFHRNPPFGFFRL
jgi:hypothetical protein